jgi:hypothetical protein
MRSCEYCEVQRERKTKLLALRNFSFYKNKKLINIHDKDPHLADYMKITFESQKTKQKNQGVFHHRTHHPILCPIKIWASIIRRILSIPNSSPNSTVNTILLPDRSTHRLSNTFLITKLRLCARFHSRQNWPPFPPKRSSHGDVPGRYTAINNKTYGEMVQ